MAIEIRRGARGAAVEDVQKRLLKLGYDLGRSGVDGVFQGATLEAVRAFQRSHGLVEDGVVGPKTWAALVDATFTLGDRTLYLRYPYLHGADVVTLQSALNVLGFPCGEVDGIFGPCTERAVREFQFNAGLPVDGVAGDETIRALERLRHVWAGKDPAVPVQLKPAPVRAASVIERFSVAIECADPAMRPVCERAANLMQAISEGARVAVRRPEDAVADEDVRILVVREPAADGALPSARIELGEPVRSTNRMVTALASSRGKPVRIAAVLEEPAGDEHAQRLAVSLVDALTGALGRTCDGVL